MERPGRSSDQRHKRGAMHKFTHRSGRPTAFVTHYFGQGLSNG